MRRNFLLGSLLRGSHITSRLHDRGLRMDSLGMRLAREIKVDKLASLRQSLAALPDGEQSDTGKRAEDPDDTDGNPAREEGLAEDVA